MVLRDESWARRRASLETIAKAASSEGMSPAKMSRSIKNTVKFNDDYFYQISGN
jgi:hypothetical protein